MIVPAPADALKNVEAMEISGHSFDILKLEKQGENWLAAFAVDGELAPPFYEPHQNVADLKSEEFLIHMKSQALAMVSYGRGDFA